ncbi:hypothetical protein ECP02989426_5254 [Escherichia coli P0298942.6]|nr:hypothetical protein ECP02989426_5254 [Escherichia coli P0298942.6]
MMTVMKKAVCFQQDLHQASVHDRRMRRERLIKPTKHLYSICCNDRAGQISVAHLAILRLSSVLARLHSPLLIP